MTKSAAPVSYRNNLRIDKAFFSVLAIQVIPHRKARKDTDTVLSHGIHGVELWHYLPRQPGDKVELQTREGEKRQQARQFVH